MDSPLSYIGGKSRLSESIIQKIPDHLTYVECFSGAAWVFFRKPPWINSFKYHPIKSMVLLIIYDAVGILSDF